MTESEEATQQPLHLIAVVPAEFPTPGYASRCGRCCVDGELSRSRSNRSTGADAVLAQMITHPCLVVGRRGPGGRPRQSAG
jgi:hypothetical protein